MDSLLNMPTEDDPWQKHITTKQRLNNQKEPENDHKELQNHYKKIGNIGT